MKTRYRLTVSIVVLAIVVTAINVFGSSVGQDFISPAATSKYIGQTKTVCGKVASVKYSSLSKRQPTFLNLDEPYPNQIFTIVIWGSDRNKFKNPPEVLFKEKRICVTGAIETYGGKPQIIVRDPSQIIVNTD